MYLISSCVSHLRKGYKIYVREKRIRRLVKRVDERLNNLYPSDNKNNMRILGGGISKHEKDKIKQYYSSYGIKLHTYSFHDFYKRVTNKFDVRFLPEDIYYCEIDEYFNNWQMARFIDNKTLYPILFKNVRQPEMICFRQNGFWYDGNGLLISPNQAKKILSEEQYVFVKVARDSYGGHGVKYLSGKDSVDYMSAIDCDLVVQKPLEQSEVLSDINPSSVNTIRVMTLLRKDGSVKVCSSVLRMGKDASKVDNASSGGITVGIQNDGKLNKIAYSVNGRKYLKHPTTGVRFDDIIIPNVSLIRELVAEQATKLPYFRLISWDVALDKNDEPVLIEANLCDGELDFHQLNNGPLFGEETEAVLSEVFSSKK